MFCLIGFGFATDLASLVSAPPRAPPAAGCLERRKTEAPKEAREDQEPDSGLLLRLLSVVTDTASRPTVQQLLFIRKVKSRRWRRG